MTGKRIHGNGVPSVQERNIGNFKGVSASGSMDIVVSAGPTHSLKIEADENLMQYIEVRNDDGVAKIYTRKGYNLNPKSKMRVHATAPSYSLLQVSGSGKISSEGRISGMDKLHTEVSGSGDIVLDVDAPRVEAEISGSGSARIKGTTRDFAAQVSGSGDIRCFDLLAENAEIDIAGSGNAEIFASKTLDVQVAGAGDVRYKGSPMVKQHTAGSGSVRQVQ